MDQNPRIDILLASYNGERFIGEQIQSLLDQTYSHWRILIRDDGSTDNTLAVISDYAKKYPEKIAVIEDDQRHLGACRNFAKLLERSTADYIMFCDQDDVWMPNKVQSSLEKIKNMEKRHGCSLPMLVYTDMKVVDERLQVISNSYWKHQAFNPKSGALLNRLLVSNVVIGCTMMFNKKLKELSLPFPQNALMHDWWLALVSVAFGKNEYIRETPIFYRQHQANVAGAKWSLRFRSVISQIRNVQKHKDYLRASQEQAEAFVERYMHLLNKTDLRKIQIYSHLKDQNCLKKRYCIIRYQFWWAGFVRSLAMFVVV